MWQFSSFMQFIFNKAMHMFDVESCYIIEILSNGIVLTFLIEVLACLCIEFFWYIVLVEGHYDHFLKRKNSYSYNQTNNNDNSNVNIPTCNRV